MRAQIERRRKRYLVRVLGVWRHLILLTLLGLTLLPTPVEVNGHRALIVVNESIRGLFRCDEIRQGVLPFSAFRSHDIKDL